MADEIRVTSRRERHKDLRRTQIVDAAYDLLREVGADELSVKMIADRADVSAATWAVVMAAICAVVSERRFLAGGAFMALSFFSLLFSLSHADVSLIAPAAGSLTFVSNAVAARWLLHENVDRRRWLAAIFVCCGVALLKQ